MPPMLCPIQNGCFPVSAMMPSTSVGASSIASVSMLWLQSPASQRNGSTPQPRKEEIQTS